MRSRYLILCLTLLLTPHAQGMAEIAGGWTITANGQATSTATCELSSQSSGDPSITLGIVSTSSLFGPGSISDSKTGSQNIDISLAGFRLSAGFDGDVSSSVILTSQGTASAAAFVGATATGLSQGAPNSSHDIFGTADLYTKGYLNGAGSAIASAEGSAQYDVSKIGSPSEVWGELSGKSTMNLKGLSSSSMASTGGTENGLHADSRVTKTIRNEISASSTSRMNAYASTVNAATANVSASGSIQSGGWDPSASFTKSKYLNEIERTSAKADIEGYAESNGDLDAADLSATLSSKASRDSKLYAEGGPATYTSSWQSSTAKRTYAAADIENAAWGSVAQPAGKIAVEWGNISTIKSGAITGEASTHALSFAKFIMNTDCSLNTATTVMTGNLTMDVYAEATHLKNALAGAIVLGTGEGTMFSSSGVMLNKAHLEGGLFHYSFVNSTAPGFATATNAITSGYVLTQPGGQLVITKPISVDTTKDPNFAFAGTEAWYYQAG